MEKNYYLFLDDLDFSEVRKRYSIHISKIKEKSLPKSIIIYDEKSDLKEGVYTFSEKLILKNGLKKHIYKGKKYDLHIIE